MLHYALWFNIFFGSTRYRDLRFSLITETKKFCLLSTSSSEAATRGVLRKKVFLKISQEKTSVSESFFNKVAGFFYRRPPVAASGSSESLSHPVQ